MGGVAAAVTDKMTEKWRRGTQGAKTERKGTKQQINRKNPHKNSPNNLKDTDGGHQAGVKSF